MNHCDLVKLRIIPFQMWFSGFGPHLPHKMGNKDWACPWRFDNIAHMPGHAHKAWKQTFQTLGWSKWHNPWHYLAPQVQRLALVFGHFAWMLTQALSIPVLWLLSEALKLSKEPQSLSGFACRKQSSMESCQWLGCCNLQALEHHVRPTQDLQ